jgi:hypothetical protein
MLTTVELYNQTTIRTAKVNNVWTYWVLTPKFGPTELSITQAHPKFGFESVCCRRNSRALLRNFCETAMPSP